MNTKYEESIIILANTVRQVKNKNTIFGMGNDPLLHSCGIRFICIIFTIHNKVLENMRCRLSDNRSE